MAIDLYKKTEETPIWKKILFIFSIIIFLFVGGMFLYYQFIKIPNNTKEVSSIQKELNMQGTAEQLAQKKRVLDAEEKIDIFKDIYSKSPVFEDFFNEFEKWIYPRVYFNQLTLNAETGEVVLSATTDSLQSVMQQMILLEDQNQIANYTISSINISEGGSVTFNLLLKINKNLLKR